MSWAMEARDRINDVKKKRDCFMYEDLLIADFVLRISRIGNTDFISQISQIGNTDFTDRILDFMDGLMGFHG